MPAPEALPESGHTHTHTLCTVKEQARCPRPKHSQKADTYFAQTYCNMHARCPPPQHSKNTDTHFARACAIEMDVERNSVTSDTKNSVTSDTKK